MDLPDVVSARKFKDLSSDQKEEVFATLLELNAAIADLPKRSLRRTLELALVVLEFKGKQVRKLQQQLRTTTEATDGLASPQRSQLQVENEKLKRILGDLEVEHQEAKQQNEKLTNEVFQLQKSQLQDSARSSAGDVSDKDSSDPLSELDKQENLLRSINTKNKHIKRLLKEIENLQNVNIEQSKIIVGLDEDLKSEKDTLNKLRKAYGDLESERIELKESQLQLNIDVQRLQGRIDYLEEEKLNEARERHHVVIQMEQKAEAWRQLLQTKDKKLKKLKYNKDLNEKTTERPDLQQQPSNRNESSSSKTTKDNEDVTNLLHLLECREMVIEQQEERIKIMAEEMLKTTQVMNEISREREEQRNPKTPRLCCKAVEAALTASNSKCAELSQMLERAEEESSLKAKEALEARKALKAYQQGEDGLTAALQKCSTLEHKLQMRESKMRSMVVELNSLHEIAQENTLLRKRLHLPDDMIISAKNLAAKGRNKDKIIERLKLKLRASEELRLQLKLDKAELRKELMKAREGQVLDDEDDENAVNSVEVQVDLQAELQMKVQAVQTVASELMHEDLILKSPLNQTSNTVPVASSKEIGEFEDSFNRSEEGLVVTVCSYCHNNYNIELKPTSNPTVNYDDILQENFVLRQGMMEILEKLRDYDASSDQVVIDQMLLQALLTKLKAHSAVDAANASTSPLASPLYSGQHLSAEISASSGSDSDSDKSTSFERIRRHEKQDKAIRNAKFDLLNSADSSSRPPTPGIRLPNERLTEIPDHQLPTALPTTTKLEQPKDVEVKLQELEIYRKHYEELRLHMNASETEVLQRYSALSERLISCEKDLLKSRTSYEYLKQDFDQHLSDMKRLQLEHIENLANAKEELQQQIFLNEQLTKDLEQHSNEYAYTHDDMTAFQKSHNNILMKLALASEQLIQLESTSKRNDFDIPDLCMDYGIIKDNFQLDYIAVEDYERQKQIVHHFEQQRHDLQHKICELESLLDIAREQIKSQQRLLNDITDNHINLRHLVADLQNTNEDKLLLTKLQRDLDNGKQDLLHLRNDYQTLQQHTQHLEKQLQLKQQVCQQLTDEHKIRQQNSQRKIKFLQKSLFILKEKYAKFTPLVLLTTFISAYRRVQKLLASHTDEMVPLCAIKQQAEMFIQAALDQHKNEKLPDDQTHIIKLIKVETQTKLYEHQINKLEKKCQQMEMELSECRLYQANQTEHWQTIQALFADDKHQQTQDMACDTEAALASESPEFTRQTSPNIMHSKGIQVHSVDEQKLLDNKAIQTLEVQSEINPSEQTNNIHIQTTLTRLQEIEQSYILATEYIQELEKKIGSLQATQLEQQHKLAETTSPAKLQTDVIEKTILTFHTLLKEKDRDLGKYQDMQQTEREQNHMLINKLNQEIENLNKTVTSLNGDINRRDLEILELKSNLEALSSRTKPVTLIDDDDDGDNSLHEMTDEKIEAMFQQDDLGAEEDVPALVKPKADERAVQTNADDSDLMKQQLKELKDKASFWESSIRVKDEELSIVKEKLKFLQEREKCLEQTNTAELDQLRHLLEDKQQHINQLMDTLKNFHEDQQHYLDDASNYSADQIAKLASDLSRTEATNKIYHTQLEALRKQLACLAQRERQAREQSYSLRNQLIKRPVVAVKTEINARVKNENLQRRIQQLEMQLEESKAELQKQTFILEAKRIRSTNEVSLWEKQKRWQQNAEKYKAKLEETEANLEKNKQLLQSARNTINRLEKDKHALEQRLNKVPVVQRNQAHDMKCGRLPSCPNLHHQCSSSGRGGSAGRVASDANGVFGRSGSGDIHYPVKYSTSDSPDSYMENNSDSSSAEHMVYSCTDPAGLHAQSQQDIIDALKARLEMQQRKIHILQLDGKGSNLLANEMEKLQEQLSAIEAQNIRLEASNLQLQLDNDLLRQGDHTERLEKRIKHLEDYIIALKEEIAASEAKQQLCKCAAMKVHTQCGQSAEQTILLLRNLVDKLKTENKYLKEGRRSCETKQSLQEAGGGNDVVRLQRLYRESLDKITALQMDLKTGTKCPHCEGKQKQTQQTDRHELQVQLQDELKSIREQLVKKTQLLQKAKVLLTRAAAKEKMLKDQLAKWKRKCSELQNMPVIDETSE